jgi:alpha-ribazole phosphatase/probable phosphoglycerate mutase
LTHILLVRHGETEWNAERRVQGHLNSRLSARGRRQAEAIAARLARVPLTAVYSSDLTRALDTATPIAAAHGLPVVSLPALREKSFGEWEGLTEPEIKANWPDGWHCFHVLRQIDYAIPGGETWEQVQTRVLGVLGQVLRDHPSAEDRVVLVGHGGSLRVAFLDALQAPLPTLRRMSLSNASLSRLEYDPERGGRLTLLNDTSHWDDEER